MDTLKSNGSEYLVITSAYKNKEVLTKYTELIKAINGGKADEYEKDFIKNKFNSDDNLPLNKILKLHNLTIIVDLFLKKMENITCKFFQMNVYMKYKCQNMMEQIFPGIDIIKMSALKECDVCHYWYFLDKSFKYEPYFVMVLMI